MTRDDDPAAAVDLMAGLKASLEQAKARRIETEERLARIRKQAEITNHLFEGDGPFCQAMLGQGSQGSPETGVFTMSVQCGYPADLHVAHTENGCDDCSVEPGETHRYAGCPGNLREVEA